MLIDLFDELEHAVLHKRVADLEAHGLQVGERHPAADDDLVHLFPQILDDADLAGDLGAAQDRHEGPHGVGHGAFQVLDFLAHEKAGPGRGEIFGDARDGGVVAVGGPEGVVDVDVGQRGQRLRELVVVLLLAEMEPEVLQQEHVTRLHPVHQHLGLRADAVLREEDFFAQQALEAARDRRQTQARVHFPVGAPQVGAQDHPRAFVHRVVDGREGASDAGIVRDMAALIQRHVEVRADDDALSPERQVLDGDFVQMHAEGTGTLSRGRPCI